MPCWSRGWSQFGFTDKELCWLDHFNKAILLGTMTQWILHGRKDASPKDNPLTDATPPITAASPANQTVCSQVAMPLTRNTSAWANHTPPSELAAVASSTPPMIQHLSVKLDDNFATDFLDVTWTCIKSAIFNGWKSIMKQKALILQKSRIM